jgi:hypothetical protein
MKPQEFELLLMAMAILFTGVSVYTIRLWLNLRDARQLISKLVIVQATPVQPETHAESGCAGFLIVLLMIALVLTIVVLNG